MHFSSAKEFNDPFDCAIPIRYDKADLNFYEWACRHLYNMSHDKASIIAETMINVAKVGENSGPILDQLQEKVYDELAISSLSAINNDLLMWSHYGVKHQGICVGFNSQRLVDYIKRLRENDSTRLSLAEVGYPDEYPQLIPTPNNHDSLFVSRFHIKAPQWSYEKEWRLILIRDNNTRLILDSGIIDHVILGLNINDENEKEIKQILRENSYRVNLYKAKRVPNKFGIDVSSKIEY